VEIIIRVHRLARGTVLQHGIRDFLANFDLSHSRGRGRAVTMVLELATKNERNGALHEAQKEETCFCLVSTFLLFNDFLPF
jgi:hypothetical protein